MGRVLDYLNKDLENPLRNEVLTITTVSGETYEVYHLMGSLLEAFEGFTCHDFKAEIKSFHLACVSGIRLEFTYGGILQLTRDLPKGEQDFGNGRTPFVFTDGE